MNPNELRTVLDARDAAERRRQSKRAMLVVFVGIPACVVVGVAILRGLQYLAVG